MSSVYRKLIGWKHWYYSTERKSRRIRRKFARVSREEIEGGVADGELDGYGKYDESDLAERDMFFDD